MKKFMKFLHSKKATVVLAAVAFALLLGSAVGSTNAALTYYSEDYIAQVSMWDIGVSLVEMKTDDKTSYNSKTDLISQRNYTGKDDVWNETSGELLSRMLDDTNGKLVVNHAYPEYLYAYNSGNIDEYVRMRVYKYWVDADGNKTTALSPDLINIEINDGSGWIKGEQTKERTYFYWPNVLAAGDMTNATIKSITIDGQVSKYVTTVKNSDGSWKTTYDYNGYKFVLEAEVDAVQTHNYKAAIKSAWGVDADEVGIKGGE